MKKPSNLRFGVDDTPPMVVTWLNGIQHVAVISISLIEGRLLELPERRPSEEEIRETEEGLRKLAGFMLRRNADRGRRHRSDREERDIR